MKNLIKVLSLTAIISITVIACNEKKECIEGSKKECCEKKEASTNDSEDDKPCCKKEKEACGPEYDKPCCNKKKKECKPDCDKPCCSTKADTEEIDSNNIILENEVVEDDII